MKLYLSWMSSCSSRVVLALLLKKLPFESKIVTFEDLVHRKRFYEEVNPLMMVPILETDDGTHIADSVAIMEYLEEKYPEKPLLPQDTNQRALVRQIVNLVTSSIQPLQNHRVVEMIREKLGSEERKLWMQHWIKRGFSALESILTRSSRTYCVGSEVTLADVVLVPQVAKAVEFGVNMAEFPTVSKVYGELCNLPEVQELLEFKKDEPQ